MPLLFMDAENRSCFYYVYCGMMKKLLLSICLLAVASAYAQQHKPADTNHKNFEVVKTDAEWKKLLSPDAYTVLRKKGTERAFTGSYYDHHEAGTYCCAGCGNPLFSSAHKFESGTGWPSFYQPVAENKIIKETDNAYGMVRTEVMCAKCGGHLGHVFDDGPQPTGLRYCINSVALSFKKN
jgi:peptide-methionine (R)-S-oxide reductase